MTRLGILYNRTLDVSVHELYYDALAHEVEDAPFKVAVREAVTVFKFMPNPAEILSLVPKPETRLLMFPPSRTPEEKAADAVEARKGIELIAEVHRRIYGEEPKRWRPRSEQR